MTSPSDRPLDYAERWMRDSLQVLRPAFSTLQITVDMTNALQRLDQLKREGVHASTTHLLVQAAARALASNPDLHTLIASNRKYHPKNVAIGLSITGDHFLAPVLVIENGDQKTIGEIAEEITRRAPEVRQADHEKWIGLRRWGWLVPFGFLRRVILRVLMDQIGFRLGAGTFQVSTVPVDWALASTFVAPGVLVGGYVGPRVLVVKGQAIVRQTINLALSVDHGIWDGRAAARFMAAVKADLERAEG